MKENLSWMEDRNDHVLKSGAAKCFFLFNLIF